MKRFLVIPWALIAVACGPSVSESRLLYFPPQGPDCALEFVQADMSAMRPGGSWEVVGYVTLAETGVADPFSERYRSVVRPRACAMGGEAVTIMSSTTSTAALGSGSGTIYGVLRRPSGDPPPGRF